MSAITSIVDLEKLYGSTSKASSAKILKRLSQAYSRFIEVSPFVALASVGEDGIDCSPRGDRGNVVTIANDKTLLLPDWRGNNRLDTLRNIVVDPRVSLMFLVPGSEVILRVNGKAIVSADREICNAFEMEGKHPTTVITIEIGEVYFQCARAIKRAQLWDASSQSAAINLPTAGDMLKEATNGEFDGKEFDKNWPERAEKFLW
ncbi:Phosphohydrolase (MutT/nudix family protein) [hydrothermal vent metagenome]|uniref:Phosphohydrolase (MutT/nudix family protein) n=1 Tax=hydrothermal vent metagenome TaxID=652676 RepID=A0A3B0TS88_9ZZZZ